MELARLIKEGRARSQLSQTKFAVRVGINSQTVSDVERDLRPLPRHCFPAVSEATGIPVADLEAALAAWVPPGKRVSAA